MNLSVLERMAREGDMSSDAMRYLLECHGECEWLDYKSELSLKIDKELCDFARDALAIKNVGGGYIVIGVQDKSWKPIGLRQRIEYDSKLLRDQVRRALGVELEVDIVHHEIQMPSSTGLFALILSAQAGNVLDAEALPYVAKTSAPPNLMDYAEGTYTYVEETPQ